MLRLSPLAIGFKDKNTCLFTIRVNHQTLRVHVCTTMKLCIDSKINGYN